MAIETLRTTGAFERALVSGTPYYYCSTTSELLSAIGSDRVIALAANVTYDIAAQANLNGLSNLTIHGGGYSTNLVLNVTDIGIGGSACTRVIIENLRVSGTSSRAISFITSTFCVVRNCWVSGATLAGTGLPAGVYMGNCDDCTVEGNILSGNGFGTSNTQSSCDIFVNKGGSRNLITDNRCSSAAVTMNIIIQTDAAAQTCAYNEISHNVVSGAITKTDNTIWGYGIAVYKSTSDNTHARVIGNLVHSTGGSGIYFAGASDCVCSGNIVRNVNLTSAANNVQAGIHVNTDSVRVSVTGNLVNNSLLAGIMCGADDSTISGNVVDAGTYIGIRGLTGTLGLTISGNTVANLTTTSGVGIQVDTCPGVSIVGNTVRGNGAHGIVALGCSGFAITGNQVVGNAQAGAAFDGILTSGTDGVISGNHSTGSHRYGVHNTGSRNAIVNNRLLGNVTADINDTGTLTYRRGNQRADAAMQGVSTPLVGGTLLIGNTQIRTGDTVTLTHATAGGTLGVLSLGAIVDNTSFVINSSSGTDTSTVFWEIVH